MPVDYERVYPADPSGEPPGYAGLLSSPIVALARAAAVTSTLRLGSGVCLLPLHEPISFAKDIATLDADSGGRFLFGVGAGWMREETQILGLTRFAVAEATQRVRKREERKDALPHSRRYTDNFAVKRGAWAGPRGGLGV